jgi:U3 small nucleolar ribonucleoprotein component
MAKFFGHSAWHKIKEKQLKERNMQWKRSETNNKNNNKRNTRKKMRTTLKTSNITC